MAEVIRITNDINEADAVLALAAKIKKNQHFEEIAKSRGIPIFVTKVICFRLSDM
jgi:hypothetical protein